MVAFSQGPPTAAVLATAGCAKLAAEYDWSSSEFGPQEQWAPAVETIVRTLLETTVPMAYCHGAGYAMVYNDRFADLLGPRHPRAWGQQAAVAVPEIWSRPGLAEAVDNVLAGGRSFHDDGEVLELNGLQQTDPEWAYLVRSYSAIRDSDGSVLGVLIVVVEIASVVVSVGGREQGDRRAARWRGIELWDETVALPPLILSGFRTGARSLEASVADSPQQFVAERRRVDPSDRRAQRSGLHWSPGDATPPLDAPMPTVPSRYQPATTGTAVRGDFYDGFRLPDGRLAVTIGDVNGGGVAAPAIMGQVRAGLRRAALTNSDPSAIFTALDDLVRGMDVSSPDVSSPDVSSPDVSGPDVSSPDVSRSAAKEDGPGSAQTDSAGLVDEPFVTALFGIFDPATGELLLSSAGQFSPAVVRRRAGVQADAQADAQAVAGQLVEFAMVEPGPRLGVTGSRPVSRLALEEGDALVVFTDGLLERHDRSVTQGRETLLRTLSTMAATAPRSISQHVVDELIDGEGLEYDCALLVVVRDSRDHQMASALVPPHSIAVRGARRWVRGQLEAWGLDDEITADAVMGVSELVTNVMLHAGTPARVTMELAERLLVMVEDTGTWGAPRQRASEDRSASGRGLALVAAKSDAMGYARGIGGSTVWFEIALDRLSR